MTRTFVSVSLAMMVCAGAQAATINTTLTVNATVNIGTTITVTGTATLTNIGSGPITGTLSLTPDSAGNLSAPFTITLTTGGPGTINGTVKIPSSAVLGGTVTGSATVTGGTGNFDGATGTFTSLTGTGSINPATAVITLSFSGAGTIFTGGSGGPPTPTVTAVWDGATLTKNVAQGSIFVVEGSNMSASGLNQSGFPLTTSLNGVKITFTPASGGSGTDAFLVNTFNQSGVNQLAAILPSTVATGNYNVTVTNNGAASAAFAATVVQRKPGLFTQDSSGSGLAVVQNFISAAQLDVNRFTTNTISGTTISPARPGQVLVAWATGLGPVTGGDNTASPGFNFSANGVNVQAIVGGVSITPAYAGRAPGLAGADQINFTLPANIPTGCTVSFQLSVNGVLSNPSFVAIAPDASSSACVVPGFTTAQLQKFDQGGTFTVGAFSLTQISETVSGTTVKLDQASGAFTRFTGFQLAGAAAQAQAQITPSGACQSLHFVSTAGQTPSPVAVGNFAALDAGAITLNGPAGSNITNAPLKEDATSNVYSLSIGTEGLPTGVPGLGGIGGTIVAGTYTLAGAGGKGVGAFNASITVGSPLTIAGGLPTTVSRSSDLTLNWTGGNASDLVEVIGFAGSVTGTGATATTDLTEFICTTTAGKGTLTVPASILSLLPAVSTSASTNGTATGFLEVASSINPTSGNGLFTAPLTAGGSIDAGYFLSLVGIAGTVAYQ
jgi:uncharacterized protein (TIGR03437 family)